MGAQDSAEVLRLFNESLELVEIIAHQVARSLGGHMDHSELVSFGREGLLLAARRFDPERGVPFRAYANYRVRGAILDGIRQMAALPRRAHERLRALQAAADFNEGAAEDQQAAAAPGATPRTAEQALSDHLAGMATAMAVGLLSKPVVDGDGVTSLDPASSPEEVVAEGQILAAVQRAIDELPEEEALLVRRHYFEGNRLDELAVELGLSKSWVSRMHTRAVQRLSRRLRSLGS